jgi:nuclear transport factor 2 (NTF2) superfamily protein
MSKQVSETLQEMLGILKKGQMTEGQKIYFADSVVTRRLASINDLPITEPERKYHWPLGRRPDGHPTLSDLGL